MESFKQLVQSVQLCQSALRVPEEVMPNLSICRTALRLQQEASQLQHVAIQQCNILQVRAARSHVNSAPILPPGVNAISHRKPFQNGHVTTH